MPKSLRCKIKKLCYNGTLTEKERDMILKALEQQPSEDCISREEVIKGLANIAKAKAKSDAQKSMMGRCMFFVEQLPPVTPTPRTNLAETSQDCISRQAVIDYAKDTCVDLDKYEDTEIFCDEIKALPPVTPQRPKGKWINKYYMASKVMFKRCSECDYEYSYDAETGISDANYCPNCGAEMED